jgi:uncharacterized LabA/DUF88 family protein
MTEVVSARSVLLTRRPVLSLKSTDTRSTELHSIANTSWVAADPATNAIALRAMCFFDGQNLYASAKHAFGTERNVRPVDLARAVCRTQGWRCEGVHYYQGSPDPNREPSESHLWNRRRSRLEASGVHVFDRRFQYSEYERQLPDGTSETMTRVKEKGIDVRLALDVVELGHKNLFDVAVLFCRDQDLSELVPTIQRLSLLQDRTIKLVSAFPTSEANRLRGIDGMNWLEIDKSMYESCCYRDRART